MDAMILLAALACLSLPAHARPGAPATGVCLFYFDAKDGNLWRSSVDGSHREPVIRCQALKGGRLAPTVSLHLTRPSAKTRGNLTVSTIPYGEGYTVVDAAPAGSFADIYPADEHGRTVTQVIYADTFRPSGWVVSFKKTPVAIEPRHYHDRVDALDLDRGGEHQSYPFSKPHAGGEDALLGILSSGHAVVLDNHNVVLWDLSSGAKRVVASAVRAVLWPRDLSIPTRFAPIACLMVSARPKARFYRWTMKNPDDFHPRPEYLVGASVKHERSRKP